MSVTVTSSEVETTTPILAENASEHETASNFPIFHVGKKIVLASVTVTVSDFMM